jgi:chromosome partition protein MukF
MALLLNNISASATASLSAIALVNNLSIAEALELAISQLPPPAHIGGATSPALDLSVPEDEVGIAAGDTQIDDETAPVGQLTVSETIAKVLVSKFSIDISTRDAAFVCGIYAHMNIARQASLEEEELDRIYHAVAEAAIDDGIGIAQRSAAAISRLRKQGLLERADSKGMAAYGTYTLSTLAIKLRDDIFEREALTKRSLRILMKRVIADLAVIRDDARRGGNKDHWDENVTLKMRYLVSDVLRGIIQRQKGLEAEQAEIRVRILALLRSDNWKETNLVCNELLDRTSSTLEELHTILLEEMGAAQNLLIEIADIATSKNNEHACAQANQLQDQIDSIGLWSENFRKTWSAYYAKIHEYIRFMLKFDPNRQIMTRLRESLKGYSDGPWHLVTAAAERMAILREDMEPPTARVLAKIKVKTQKEAEDTVSQLEAMRDQLVADAIAWLDQHGKLVLSDFLTRYFGQVDDDELFMMAGFMQAWLMGHETLSPRRSDQWIALRNDLEIQDVVAVRV